MSTPNPVGRVVATELKPSTPHQFHFWTARESPIGIGAIVRVEEGGRVVYGVVTDGFAYSDLATPMHAVIGADGDPIAAGTEATVRAEIRLFTAAVLRQIPEEPLQPVPLGSVWMASDADVVLALRMDAYTGGDRPTGIPVGLYAAGGLESPVYLDCDFLLGPEAAHLNITGVSGLATKTSAVEFLLSSIFQTFPAHKGSVAAVCFNVKGPDLCFLDQPARLDEEDERQYARLGLRAEPFQDVRYYAPLKADGVNLNSLRTNEAGGRPGVRGRDAPDQIVPRAELRRPGRVLPGHLRLHGSNGTRLRGLEDPPRRDHPQGAQPSQQYQHPLQGPCD
ncbi:MAG: hypothetical protein K0S19_2135 [Geminicoccaceae bacterium]|nr:hypothetical protein [Geminicoccaceae bacterium]